jgi:hypothetical protein
MPGEDIAVVIEELQVPASKFPWHLGQIHMFLGDAPLVLLSFSL